jgi:hypothetical protein
MNEESTYLTKEKLIAASKKIEEDSRHLNPHQPLILHPQQYAEAKRRGWITQEGHLDWAKIVEDMKKEI